MYNERHLENLWRNRQRRVNYVPLKDVIGGINDNLQKLGSSRLAKLKTNWAEVVGDELTGLCFPLHLKSDILTIAVYSSAVRFHLEQFHRQAVIERICEVVGKKVRDIKCIVDASVLDA